MILPHAPCGHFALGTLSETHFIVPNSEVNVTQHKLTKKRKVQKWQFWHHMSNCIGTIYDFVSTNTWWVIWIPCWFISYTFCTTQKLDVLEFSSDSFRKRFWKNTYSSYLLGIHFAIFWCMCHKYRKASQVRQPQWTSLAKQLKNPCLVGFSQFRNTHLQTIICLLFPGWYRWWEPINIILSDTL